MAWIITGLTKLKQAFDATCAFITKAAEEQPHVVGAIIVLLTIYFLVSHVIHLIH